MGDGGVGVSVAHKRWWGARWGGNGKALEEARRGAAAAGAARESGASEVARGRVVARYDGAVMRGGMTTAQFDNGGIVVGRRVHS